MLGVAVLNLVDVYLYVLFISIDPAVLNADLRSSLIVIAPVSADVTEYVFVVSRETSVSAAKIDIALSNVAAVVASAETLDFSTYFKR